MPHQNMLAIESPVTIKQKSPFIVPSISQKLFGTAEKVTQSKVIARCSEQRKKNEAFL